MLFFMSRLTDNYCSCGLTVRDVVTPWAYRTYSTSMSLLNPLAVHDTMLCESWQICTTFDIIFCLYLQLQIQLAFAIVCYLEEKL